MSIFRCFPQHVCATWNSELHEESTLSISTYIPTYYHVVHYHNTLGSHTYWCALHEVWNTQLSVIYMDS